MVVDMGGGACQGGWVKYQSALLVVLLAACGGKPNALVDGGESAVNDAAAIEDAAIADARANSDAATNCVAVQAAAAAVSPSADLVIAVDSSGSMSTELGLVRDNLNTLTSIVSLSGVDLHLVLISSNDLCVPVPLGSGSCPADEVLPGYRHVDQVVGSNNALSLIVSSYSQWQSSLRADASKTMLVVSDDDSALDAATFLSQLQAIDPPSFDNVVVSSLAGSREPVACLSECLAGTPCPCVTDGCSVVLSSAEGVEYKSLSSSTGGAFYDLCSQDFAGPLNEVALGILQRTPTCRFSLPAIPNGGSFDAALVDVSVGVSGTALDSVPHVQSAADCAATEGWFYDDNAAPTLVELCPSVCDTVQPVGGHEVRVDLACTMPGDSGPEDAGPSDAAPAPVNVSLFSTATLSPGADPAYAGRAGVDAWCAAHVPVGQCANVHALLAISPTDTIAELPTTFAFDPGTIYGPGETTVVAASWADLLSGTLVNSLASAGVFNTEMTCAWSGVSDQAGAVATAATTCDGWSTSDVGAPTMLSVSTTSNWLAAGAQGGCSGGCPIVCMCY